MGPKLDDKDASIVEEIFRNAAANAYPEYPEVRNYVRVRPSKKDNIDYQFHCGPIASFLKMKIEDIAVKIIENVQDTNDFLKKIEVSKTGFVNILVRKSNDQSVKCTCKVKTNVGPHDIDFTENGIPLCQKMTEELSNLFSNILNSQLQRQDVSMFQKICQNFQFFLGGDYEVKDIREAVLTVGKRDYPELDSEIIPTIFVPKLFLPQHPEAVHIEKYIKKLKEEKEKLENSIDIDEARELKSIEKLNKRLESMSEVIGFQIFSDTEQELLRNHNIPLRIGVELNTEQLKKIETLTEVDKIDGKITKLIGERAEKKVYELLRECIKDEETVVIHNFKIMTLQDLDQIAEDHEKDFVIFNLKKRFIMSLEVKSSCNESSLKSARKQIKHCKEMISKWCGSDLSKENGWKFFSTIFFENISEEFVFCEHCSKFIFTQENFAEKFAQLIEDIPSPLDDTKVKSREEFRNFVKCMLFLASYEPVVTPTYITNEVVKMIERAGSAQNIILWNKIFCWTPKQLSFLKDELLKKVLFLSPPSCGKTILKKAKVKHFAKIGENVVFLVPCFNGIKTLLYFHLKKEFESLESENIKVDNVR